MTNKYNYERWAISLLILLLIVVYFDKRETIREMEITIAQQEIEILKQANIIEDFEEERENLIDAIDLRESEVSFWGQLSELYREGKKKEAEEFRGNIKEFND